MSSTRNKNTIENYRMEQRALESARSNLLYEHSSNGNAFEPLLPGDGLLGARIAHTNLSHNAVDVESFLYGIGSTNLVQPQDPVSLQSKNLRTLEIVDRRLPVFIPEPLVIEHGQRPNFRS